MYNIIQLANMGVYAIAIANILHFDFTNIDEIKLQLKNMNMKTRIARNVFSCEVMEYWI